MIEIFTFLKTLGFRQILLFIILGFVVTIFLGFLFFEIKRNLHDPDK
jgi:hypothetical protein